MKKNHILTFLALLPALAFLVSGAYAAPAGYKGYPRGNALITVQELKSLIDAHDPNFVLVAAQSNLEYLPGHIPGAQQVDRPAIAAPPETQSGVEGNIINAAEFTRLAQSLGINRRSTVVIYEDRYDATRLWWAFTYYGKSDVRILDGGIQAWKAAGFPVEILPPAARPKIGNFVAAVTHVASGWTPPILWRCTIPRRRSYGTTEASRSLPGKNRRGERTARDAYRGAGTASGSSSSRRRTRPSG
jgi:thiosulfate/3-mercaptopyruvate sulfurtransferase